MMPVSADKERAATLTKPLPFSLPLRKIALVTSFLFTAVIVILASLFSLSVLPGGLALALIFCATISVVICSAIYSFCSGGLEKSEILSIQDPSLFFDMKTSRLLTGEEEPNTKWSFFTHCEGFLSETKAPEVERQKNIKKLLGLFQDVKSCFPEIWFGDLSVKDYLYAVISSDKESPFYVVQNLIKEILSRNGEETLEALLSMPRGTMEGVLSFLDGWTQSALDQDSPKTKVHYFLAELLWLFDPDRYHAQVQPSMTNTEYKSLCLQITNLILSFICFRSFNDRKNAFGIIKKYCPSLPKEKIHEFIEQGNVLAFLLSRLSKEHGEKQIRPLNFRHIGISNLIAEERKRGEKDLFYTAYDEGLQVDFDREKRRCIKILKNLELPSCKTFFFSLRYKDLKAFFSLIRQAKHPFIVLEAMKESSSFLKSLKVFLKTIMPLNLWEKSLSLIWFSCLHSGVISSEELEAFCRRSSISRDVFISTILQGRSLKFLFPQLFKNHNPDF